MYLLFESKVLSYKGKNQIDGGALMYLNGLDGLDQKIVRLLIENARISYSDIGEKSAFQELR